ncbi:MAG: T9SS type A sorting domain-containing protein [Rhodothermales bacterium]|nr:T9SS type A sorting domain-containing protein [Rhodothermales bacterium]
MWSTRIAVFAVLISVCATTDTAAQFVETKIWHSELGSNDHFARSSAIDGDKVLIGAVTKGPGEAYLFEKSGGMWTETFNFEPTDGAQQDYYSRSLDIDGNVVVIGSERHDVSGTNAGAVYVYEFTTTWVLDQKVLSSDIATEDRFGTSVAVSGDVFAVGAPEEDANGDGSGSVYVFRNNGTSWVEEAKLTASDGVAGDEFGFSIAMSGNDILVGAWEHNSGQGAAYVYHYNGVSWIEEAKLEAADGASGDQFGSWWISIDGDYAAVGALLDNSEQGAAYVFNRIGTTWSQQAKLTHTTPVNGDQFGVSASIDGDYMVVGSFGGEYTNVYMRSGITWGLIATLEASDGEPGDDFGYTAVISGMNVVVGADDDIVNGFTSGSAYVYDLDSPLAIEISEFNALLDGSTVIFDWKLESLVSVATIDVEALNRYTGSWASLVEIPPSGWATTGISISVPDDDRYELFRLAVRDTDGLLAYSENVRIEGIVQSNREMRGPWPNPVLDEAHFFVPGSDSQARYSLYDSVGRKVRSGSINTATEGSTLSIDMKALPNGVYHFVFHDGSRTRSKSVVKQ